MEKKVCVWLEKDYLNGSKLDCSGLASGQLADDTKTVTSVGAGADIVPIPEMAMEKLKFEPPCSRLTSDCQMELIDSGIETKDLKLG
ncbi:hypothetical protein WISP_73240 [Willisornis vidua]|uniref:Uncharacterized protein n=1 Tax=Willisornis vidua TaxID=1566151 RepID=A0ABQ9D864_9PASS|nr:hypothetical protein WISP_73240 [Willisornis vidua]